MIQIVQQWVVKVHFTEASKKESIEIIIADNFYQNVLRHIALWSFDINQEVFKIEIWMRKND